MNYHKHVDYIGFLDLDFVVFLKYLKYKSLLHLYYGGPAFMPQVLFPKVYFSTADADTQFLFPFRLITLCEDHCFLAYSQLWIFLLCLFHMLSQSLAISYDYYLKKFV